MSDHYLFNLRMVIRADAPASLHAALTIRASGTYPTASDLPDLPGTVRDYLRGSGAPGDSVHLYEATKYWDPSLPAGQPQYADGYQLRMSQTFHDDEYFNQGIYYPYWLMQFAIDGQLGTMHQINGDEPPTIYVRVGPLLHETKLAYHPAELWPIPGQASPDPAAPLIVKETTTHVIADLLDQMSIFADGPDYG